jgi:hypothetical protein
MSNGGDWAETARRLVEALRTAAPPAPDGGSAAATGTGGDCRWCPLCQAAAVLRGERPEVTAALADVLTATATALRQFAGEPAGAHETGEPATEDREQPDPVVQRIELA